MTIHTEFVNLSVADGTSMRAYIARAGDPSGGTSGGLTAGVMVFQEIFGVNRHIREVTERFAQEGYLAIAPELFHRTGPGFESDYSDMAPGRAHAQAITDDGLTADIRATLDWLQNFGGAKFPVGAIGFCMGGRVACLSAMTAPVTCAVSYYGSGIAPHPFYKINLLDRFAEIHAPILYCWGGLDGFIKPENVHQVTQAMRAANKPFVSAEFADADHGFFCDLRASYHSNAAREAWALTLAFLKNHVRA